MKEKTVSQFFEEDHDRLDDLFKNFQKFKKSDFARAKEYFISFQYGLQRHIVWEEEILFPLFEQKTGDAFSMPVYVMRLEHQKIAGYLEAIHKKVHAHNANTDEEEEELLSTLSMHNQKEETILYPTIDQALTQEDREFVFIAIRNIPEERYQFLCGSA